MDDLICGTTHHKVIEKLKAQIVDLKSELQARITLSNSWAEAATGALAKVVLLKKANKDLGDAYLQGWNDALEAAKKAAHNYGEKILHHDTGCPSGCCCGMIQVEIGELRKR